MKFLNSEEKLILTYGHMVMLTNYRVLLDDKESDRAYSISIFLENISSIETLFRVRSYYLFIAVVSGLAGLWFSINEVNGIIPTLAFLTAVLFLILWLFSRKHLVVISSNGGRPLTFHINGAKSGSVENFVTAVLEAKLERVSLNLRNSNICTT